MSGSCLYWDWSRNFAVERRNAGWVIFFAPHAVVVTKVLGLMHDLAS